MTYAMMAKTTKLMPLMRHKRSQNPRVLVDEAVAVVDALMRISSRAEGGQSDGDRGWILWTYRASSPPCQRWASVRSGFPFATTYVAAPLPGVSAAQPSAHPPSPIPRPLA